MDSERIPLQEDSTPKKAHPILRLLAAFGCAVFVALAILFFPIEGILENKGKLFAPLGAVIGAVFCGKLALTGRASLRP